jgi:putative transposase
MTDVMTTKKPKKQKAPSLIPVELIDQLLAS